MLSINPIYRWPSSRITVKMLTGAPWSVVCSRAAAYVCRNVARNPRCVPSLGAGILRSSRHPAAGSVAHRHTRGCCRRGCR